MTSDPGRRGTTLVEIAVTLVLVALLTSLVAIAPLRRPVPVEPQAGLRDSAIRSRERLVVRDTLRRRALLLPDGRTITEGTDDRTARATP